MSDFTPQPDTLIFLNTHDYNVWLHRYQQHITTTINTTDTPYPVLYQFADGRLVIVQNVKTAHLTDVLFVIDYWIKHQQNIGFDAIAIQQMNIQPTVYKVNEQKQLELVKTGNTSYQVIDYQYRPDKVGQYAAMLTIL